MASASHSAETLQQGMSFMSDMASGLVPCKLEDSELEQKIKDCMEGCTYTCHDMTRLHVVEIMSTVNMSCLVMSGCRGPFGLPETTAG